MAKISSLLWWCPSARWCGVVWLLMGGLSTELSRAQEPHQSPVHDTRFLSSEACAVCHASSVAAQAMRDSQGRNVAPYDLWRGSMMAHSAVDPYWRAAVSAEVLATPSQREHIEEVCTRCHAPMASHQHSEAQSSLLGFLQPPAAQAALGLDGVSCTVCHQISEQGLGTDDSFTGGFVFNEDRLIYGPHSQPVTMPMQRHVGYTPTLGKHIQSSAMCATCHTLITDSFDVSGQPTGHSLHEQSPYLEWRNSIYNDEVAGANKTGQSCQSCHMPQADVDGRPIATRLAHNPGGFDFPFLTDRQPYGRHTFAGGNTFMLALLRDHRRQLGLSTPGPAFERAIEAARKLLSSQSAELQVHFEQSPATGGYLDISVVNLAGHKFPTAYPARRSWLEVVVRDQNEKVVYATGSTNARGQLIDQAGNPLASELPGGPIQPHYQMIERPEEVQIYESFMGDTAGQVTFALLRGSQFVKDNRLLPRGWHSEHSDAAATRPYGVTADTDFTQGGDRVKVALPVPPGKYEVSVRLQFQSLSARYLAELLQLSSPEIDAFRRMVERADYTPETIDQVSLSVEVK